VHTFIYFAHTHRKILLSTQAQSGVENEATKIAKELTDRETGRRVGFPSLNTTASAHIQHYSTNEIAVGRQRPH